MIFKKFLIISFIFFTSQTYLSANTVYFLDTKMILNKSTAGKKAQGFLKKKLEQGSKDIANKEKNLLEEEKKIIEQKKVLSNDEYKKKVNELRKKVSSLQKERVSLLKEVSEKRAKAKKKLLETLNPIVKKHMIDKNIQIVLDKKSVLLADDSLDITKEIIELLNKELKSINLN
tara:strand:+ start:10470 stop:10991 length:522 start_codon:yes stop_codon:yes gene_type:complete